MLLATLSALRRGKGGGLLLQPECQGVPDTMQWHLQGSQVRGLWMWECPCTLRGTRPSELGGVGEAG